MLFPLGFLGTFLLNNFLKEAYSSRKLELEESIENLLDKNVDLGDYVGIRFLGFSLGNSKINDKKDIDSEIKAKNVYVGIMPFRSFLKQKWIVKIRPEQTAININRDFFKRDKPYEKDRSTKKSKFKYELNFNLNKYSILKFKKAGLKTKVKGNFIYKSSNRQFIADIKSNFDGKGLIKFKFNTKLNQDFLKLELFSRGLNLESSEYSIGNRKISFKKGNFKSNFKFNKSSTQTFCKGKFSFTNLEIKPEDFSENINSNLTRFFCKDNNLIVNSENFNYGTLNSKFNLNIPLNKSSNNINLKGSIGYINSLNPDIELFGNVPFWFDRRGINFGDIASTFKINRTQLSNLNIFRKNRISGFVTADGLLKGKINDPDISIKFNVDYPNYKGLRIKEKWEGEIKNQNNKFKLNMKNGSSPVPTFLSMQFDSDIKFENLNFIRINNSNNKGTLSINKSDNGFVWNANNFPLDELEFGISDNQFNSIGGTINGLGFISSDQSNLRARLAWSFGKYGNINFDNSLLDFSIEDQSFYVKSSLYPVDGGSINLEYDSNKYNRLNAEFKNITTSWSILAAIDVFNFDFNEDSFIGDSKVLNDLNLIGEIALSKKKGGRQKELKIGTSDDLNNIEIKDDMDLNEKIKFINDFLDENVVSQDKYNLREYIRKLDSRYDAKLTVQGDNRQTYKIKTDLKGYVASLNKQNENNKEEFSIELEGGLIKGKGKLMINKFPFKAINIFLNQPKEFSGGLDIKLYYDLDSKSFLSNFESENLFINNRQVFIDKGDLNYTDSTFDIDFSLLLNSSKKPIRFIGLVPLKNKDNLDLKLIGDAEFLKLVDILADENFTFKEGDINFWMKLKGSNNKNILNGFVDIKDAAFDIYSNSIKNINSLVIFDFDKIEIKGLKAFGEDSGNIFIDGSLPFYKKDSNLKNSISLLTNKFNIKTNNLNFLVDSNLNISGSVKNPIFSGNLALNNGFVNFKNSNKNQNKKTVDENKLVNWPELYWDNRDNNEEIEIISNETILNSVFLGETLPNYLNNLSFQNLKLKLGPEFKVQYSNIFKTYLESKYDLNINGVVGDDLNARGWIILKKGRANLYLTPFKLDKNKDNSLTFASRSGVVPYINFSLISKVPDSIIPIRENNQDSNISNDIDADNIAGGFGSFGIGNTRLIKIEASYEGFLDQLSFEDENKRIQLRSTPSYGRSQIIGLIGGNSANLINRAFISRLNDSDAFSEKLQLYLYPALIENNVFSNENLGVENDSESISNEVISSQAWIAEVGYDFSDSINFAVQTIPGRDDLPPTGILTLQIDELADPKNKIINEKLDLELLGSTDTNGDWKSQLQLFYRY